MDLRQEMQEIRIEFWDRILVGDPPSRAEVDRQLLAYSRSAGIDERMAFALLQACAELAREGTEAMKRNLKTAMLCWFSGGVSRTEPRVPLGPDIPHIYQIVGLNLSWRDAASLLRGNPEDYTARKRLLEQLQQTCGDEWRASFNGNSSGPFEPGMSYAQS